MAQEVRVVTGVAGGAGVAAGICGTVVGGSAAPTVVVGAADFLWIVVEVAVAVTAATVVAGTVVLGEAPLRGVVEVEAPEFVADLFCT